MRETNHVIWYVVLNGHSFTLSSEQLQPFWGSGLGTRQTYKLTQIHMWLNWLKLRHRFLCEHRDNHINSATTNLQACDSKFNHVDAHIKIVFMTLTSSGSCFGFCLLLICNMVCKRRHKVAHRQMQAHNTCMYVWCTVSDIKLSFYTRVPAFICTCSTSIPIPVALPP